MQFISLLGINLFHFAKQFFTENDFCGAVRKFRAIRDIPRSYLWLEDQTDEFHFYECLNPM